MSCCRRRDILKTRWKRLAFEHRFRIEARFWSTKRCGNPTNGTFADSTTSMMFAPTQCSYRGWRRSLQSTILGRRRSCANKRYPLGDVRQGSLATGRFGGRRRPELRPSRHELERGGQVAGARAHARQRLQPKTQRDEIDDRRRIVGRVVDVAALGKRRDDDRRMRSSSRAPSIRAF